MMEEKEVQRARRDGALYEEIFQVVGPGVTPRQLAGSPWRVSLPPKHCSHLRSIATAVRSGDPYHRRPKRDGPARS